MPTAFKNHANNARTTLAADITTVGQTSIVVASSSKFPATPFRATIYLASSDPSTGEIIYVTNVAGTTWTVTRGQESTTAQTFTASAGVNIRELVTAGDLTDIQTAVNTAETNIATNTTNIATNTTNIATNTASITTLNNKFPIQTASIGNAQVTAAKVAGYDKALVTRSGNATIANNTSVAINWDTVAYNVNSVYSNSAQSKLTAPTTGYYRIALLLRWDTASATGFTEASIRLNGTTTLVYDDLVASNAVNLDNKCYIEYPLNAGDYVEAVALQNSGGNRVVSSSNSYFSMSLTP